MQKNLFPSPVGELHFSILYLDSCMVQITLFPSPVGELHFSMAGKTCSTEKKRAGFRPLSGNYISQLVVAKPSKPFPEIVSVPCRGTTFLNCKNKADFTNRETDVSVPCRGTTFLNTPIFKLNKKGDIVSVPCRGTTFLNQPFV